MKPVGWIVIRDNGSPLADDQTGHVLCWTTREAAQITLQRHWPEWLEQTALIVPLIRVRKER